DLDGLVELFENADFRPDMLKLYPCMVLAGTKLHEMHKKGMYKPLTTEEAAEMICEFKKKVPTYCRIMRVQRDIPTKQTVAGVDRTNLRQYVDELCKQKRIRCRCIRCREAGRAKKIGKVDIIVQEYDASEGKEFFIYAEDVKNDVLLGFCRLRFPSGSSRKEITTDSALIRELHVYGSAVPIGEKNESIQHKGFGKKLLKTAEQIAKKNNKKKLLIISGVGVREYYRALGYRKEGPYMAKKL
ncbi:MAG: GNAT family N-acetyltransferase, partial [Nanoarchaeota archaeon]|nr:GNAT family N-acetyltransferase [Nanoarchaeota archaeon]